MTAALRDLMEISWTDDPVNVGERIGETLGSFTARIDRSGPYKRGRLAMLRIEVECSTACAEKLASKIYELIAIEDR